MLLFFAQTVMLDSVLLGSSVNADRPDDEGESIASLSEHLIFLSRYVPHHKVP
jgi:hypothetical protein